MWNIKNMFLIPPVSCFNHAVNHTASLRQVSVTSTKARPRRRTAASRPLQVTYLSARHRRGRVVNITGVNGRTAKQKCTCKASVCWEEDGCFKGAFAVNTVVLKFSLIKLELCGSFFFFFLNHRSVWLSVSFDLSLLEIHHLS